jgi:serine/threonine protein phosphatase PrpC
MDLRHGAASDVGRVREHNEDRFLADTDLRLFAVADGMGGRAAGEIAATIASETLRGSLESRREALSAYVHGSGPRQPHEVTNILCEAFSAASAAVFEASLGAEDRRGMGTTLSALLVAGSHAFVAHVGDSRLYLVRDGAATQITRDHTLIDELVRSGHLSREDACAPEVQRLRNVLARAVGVGPDLLVDALHFETLPGDGFLLCSDGLSHYVDEREIAELVAADAEAAPATLVRLACDRGGHDNVTAVAVLCGRGTSEDEIRGARFRRNAVALAQVPVLAELDPRQSLLVALAAETVEVAPGARVCEEDPATQCLHVVLEGRVKLLRDGAEVGAASSGEWFGDAALVDRWVRTPEAVAVEPTRIARLSREALLAVTLREPEIGSRVLQTFARDVAAGARPAIR